MPIKLSKALKISRLNLKEKGVYDSMIDFDSKLHIDPALLKNCKIPEFSSASLKVVEYFKDTISIISLSKYKNDTFWKTAKQRLTFGEGLSSGLGYSSNGTSGSGIGPKMAEKILTTIDEIIKAGISDPKIFDLISVFEEKIGPDRISDMISIILKQEFLDYTNRVCKELKVKPLKDKSGNTIIFIPKIILNDLPISAQWQDITISIAYNKNVRGSLNSIIGQSWKNLHKENTKTSLKELLLKNPELLKELISNYKLRPSIPYDFEVDHMGVTLWDVVGAEITQEYPLVIKRKSKNSDDVLDIVRLIATHYKKLIEHNGLVQHLYDEKKKLRPERFPQLLFYAIAESYCIANDLDLNREINAGSGALDFKISQGRARVNLEIKYSSNPKLEEGFTKQLATYNDAEGINAKHSIYLIIKVNENMDHKITNINNIISERKYLKYDSPEVILIDASIKPSASKR